MSDSIAIIGLGNPGSTYKGTRHNVGFSFLDYLADKMGLPAWQKKFDGLYASASISGYKVHFLKPDTYMNLSGKSVLAMQSFYKLLPEDLIIVYDDLDMEPAKVKIKTGGGAGGHNGIRSIDSMIGTNYHRLKIGIGRPEHKGEVTNYVLHPFTSEEEKIMLALYEKICQNIRYLVNKDFSKFLNNI